MKDDQMCSHVIVVWWTGRPTINSHIVCYRLTTGEFEHVVFVQRAF